MKRLIILFAGIAFLAALGAAIYLNHRSRQKAHSPAKSILMTKRLHLLDAEMEEKLLFYLAKKLGVYEGSFEIIDVTNLDTHDIAGADYILITLKAPDGKLCQITLSRGPLPWAEWQLNPENFSVVEIPQSTLLPYVENAKWMQDLGITQDEVLEYFLAHPDGIQDNIESAFLDKETGSHILPSDWEKVVMRESPFKLEINKDKGIRFVSHLKAEGSLSSYWMVDYPEDYSGPGYREYLYRKIKND